MEVKFEPGSDEQMISTYNLNSARFTFKHFAISFRNYLMLLGKMGHFDKYWLQKVLPCCSHERVVGRLAFYTIKCQIPKIFDKALPCIVEI